MPYHSCTANTPFIMSTHTITHPRQRHRLTHIPARHNQKYRKVLHTCRDAMVLCQQDCVADAGYNTAEQGEGIAMLEAVGEVGCGHTEDCRDDEDGDGANLGLFGFVAELGDDGRCEELGHKIRQSDT